MTPVARLGPPQSRGLPAFHRQARDWRTCTSSLMLDASRIDELYGRGAGGAFDSLMPLDVFGTMAVRARGSRHSQLLFGCCRCDLPRPCRSRDTSFQGREWRVSMFVRTFFARNTAADHTSVGSEQYKQ